MAVEVEWMDGSVEIIDHYFDDLAPLHYKRIDNAIDCGI